MGVVPHVFDKKAFIFKAIASTFRGLVISMVSVEYDDK